MDRWRPQSLLRVLVYHRVEDAASARSDLNPDLVTATPRLFQHHLRHLARAYTPIGADELLAACAGRHTLPDRAVLVTFDDSYRDFSDVAWPLLRQYRIPAVLFAPTAFLGDSERIFWWDALWQIVSRTRRTGIELATSRAVGRLALDDRARATRVLTARLKQLRPRQRELELEWLSERLGVHPEPTHAVLKWSAVKGLQQEGLTVAGHSRTHELLDRLDPAELTEEIAGCRDDLVRELGCCTPLFAYPNGNVDGRVMAATDAAGFKLGFTTVRGVNYFGTDDVRLLRRDDGRTSRLLFVLKLSSAVARLRTRRHALPLVVGGADR
ncbi:MAG TPA: polysaccharide deacetylase family protein [Chloroflexota bacterium]|jgi:peptidoglycan/xylan/chitin deacetylase (PgdA/CDA1 family)